MGIALWRMLLRVEDPGFVAAREQLRSGGCGYHHGSGVDNPPFSRNRIKLLLTSIDRSDLSKLEASGGLGSYDFADRDEPLFIRSHYVH